MKLRNISLQNVRSFKNSAELKIEGDISIIIGPNGGGKTNLLDTIVFTLRRYLLQSWMVTRQNHGNNVFYDHFALNDHLTNYTIEKYSGHEDQTQIISMTVEVGQRDIANMRSMVQLSTQMIEYATKKKYLHHSLEKTQQWDLKSIKSGQQFKYQIVDGNFIEPNDPAERYFREYLSIFEIDSRLREEMKLGALATPVLSLPINRAAGGFQSSISLANHNEYDQRKMVDAATSRTSSSLVSLAVGRIAQKYRMLLEADSGRAKQEFYSDPLIVSLTEFLRDLGYEWELETVNPLQNQYDIRLKKQGSSFLVSAASSGEKELFTYLFGIYALNVRDALVVIDEPELHLHPKWQTTLLSLFERLSQETGNQFLLATHSSVFVSPASIQYVSRVFSADQMSNIVRLDSDALPNKKHLFSIVNSQNNESIFFTDKVVLVEGISDRLFFEKLIPKFLPQVSRKVAYEVISVGGKGFFDAYKAVLDACRVRYVVIADLDYATNVGTEEIKVLFALDQSSVKKELSDPASRDGTSLVTNLDLAISSGNLEDLRVLWEYIKGRRTKIRTDLSIEEQAVLDEFILKKRSDNVFILREGSLENYLPTGVKSKNLDILISYLGNDDFTSRLAQEHKRELQEILAAIFAE